MSCGYQYTPRSGAPLEAAHCLLPKLPHQPLDLTEKDTGKAYCLVKGMRILVFLHGTSASMWSPPRASSAALRPVPSGIFTLMRGVTGGSFVAARLGSATISSARCASSLHKAEPSGSVCPSGPRFLVHVTVLGRL